MKTGTSDEICKRLADILPDSLPSLHIVVMPDFFLDHFLYYPRSSSEFIEEFMTVFRRGGGEIAGYLQRLAVGGNAVNISAALASLGARVSAIVKTNQLGLKILEHMLAPSGVDLTHVHADAELSLALNIEVERVNVMFGDPKGLDLDFQDLTPRDLSVLRTADFVCVFNWLYNKSGTELAKGVFRFVKDHGKGKTFLDISDPAPKLSALPSLIQNVLKAGLVDILGLNANEAYLLASQIDPSIEALSGKTSIDELGLASARILSESIASRIDLHTPSYAFSIKQGHELAWVPGFDVTVRRVTGAGDAWTAGNLIGEALGLADEMRLCLAHAVAAYYISNSEPKHPSLQELKSFLRNSKLRRCK